MPRPMHRWMPEHDHLLAEYVEREVCMIYLHELPQMPPPTGPAALLQPGVVRSSSVGEGADWLRQLIERGLFIQELEAAWAGLCCSRPWPGCVQRQTAGVPYGALHACESVVLPARAIFVQRWSVRCWPVSRMWPVVFERFTEEQVLQGQDLALIRVGAASCRRVCC